MTCKADTVIGYTVLWKVIGTNFLAAVACLHLRVPRLTQLFLSACLFQVPKASFEDGESFELIFELRLLILAGNHQSCRQMRDAHCRVSRVHALSAMTGRTIDINANIPTLDIDLNIVIGLWQYNHLSR